MDPLAVYAVTKAAVKKARNPDAEVPKEIGRAGRPSLIEAVMYRLGAHTTVDDPDAYRKESEVERWAEFDPIERYETFLRDRGLLTDDQVEAIQNRVEDEIAGMIDEAEEIEPDPMAMFERPYESPPPRVQEQKEYLAALRERHGDDALTRDE